MNKLNKNKFLEKYIVVYVLLKIQNGDWPIDKPMVSERFLANKFHCSQSIIHNTLLKLKNLCVISNNSFKNWVVKPFIPQNILGFEPYLNRKAVKVLECKTKELFNSFDIEMFSRLCNKRVVFNNTKFIYLQKNFFCNQSEKISHIMYYVINSKRIDFIDLKLFCENANAFFAKNGLVVWKRHKMIVNSQSENQQINNVAENNHTQNFHAWVYNVAYNQYGEILFYIKTAFYNFEDYKNIVVNYELQ